MVGQPSDARLDSETGTVPCEWRGWRPCVASLKQSTWVPRVPRLSSKRREKRIKMEAPSNEGDERSNEEERKSFGRRLMPSSEGACERKRNDEEEQ